MSSQNRCAVRGIADITDKRPAGRLAQVKALEIAKRAAKRAADPPLPHVVQDMADIVSQRAEQQRFGARVFWWLAHGPPPA